jgi:hypothetical protein
LEPSSLQFNNADRKEAANRGGLFHLCICHTHHRHHVLSRNVKHFEPLGVVVIDPFATLPPI